MEASTVIKDEDKKDTGQEGERQNSGLDCPPKRFLSPEVDRSHRVADHDVAEEDNPDRDKSVEGEKEGAQEGSEGADDSGNPVSAKH